MTSYEPRLPKLHKVINSILKQSVKPEKVCLWICTSDIKKIPQKVFKLEKYGLEIHECDDLKSYKKIIPCQQQFPDYTIVTCDDDVVYPINWLKSLVDSHAMYPESILCHRARLITFRPDGKTNPYRFWPYIDFDLESALVFPVGAGGVLYPAGCFHGDLTRDDIFMDICQYGDDIWLKAMTSLVSRRCRRINHFDRFFRHVRGSQKVALKKDNMCKRNDRQIEKVFGKYSITDCLSKMIQAERTDI